MGATLLWTGFAGAAPQRFDLICAGTDFVDTNGAAKPWSAELRVDLAAMKYCGGINPCTEPLKIERAEPDRIYFIDEQTSFDKDGHISLFVDRTTGQLTYLLDAPSFEPSAGYEKIEASCRLAPFTPLPRTAF